MWPQWKTIVEERLAILRSAGGRVKKKRPMATESGSQKEMSAEDDSDCSNATPSSKSKPGSHARKRQASTPSEPIDPTLAKRVKGEVLLPSISIYNTLLSP